MKNLQAVCFFLLILLFSACAGDGASDMDDNNSSPDIELIDIQTELDVTPNEFQINQDADTLIFGEQGTAIFIPANAFSTSDSQDAIDISLKEYYDLSDILMQDLSTEADKGLLETGGMIHLEAEVNGRLVSLKPDKKLVIHFPKNGNMAEMELFSQYYTDGPNNTIKWKEEKRRSGKEIDTLTPFLIKYDDLDTDFMLTEDGVNIWNWLEDEVELTEKERDYVRLRDVNVKFDVTKTGKVTNVHLEKAYDKKRTKRLLKIVKEMPDYIPFKRSGKPIDMECWINFAVKFIPAKHLSNEEYLSEIENKYPDFENQNINDIDQVELNYYIFTTAKLGWLNCDHFVDDPSPKVNMSLNLPEPENMMIKFIFKDFKSIITPVYQDGINYFNGIPADKEITLLLIQSDKKAIKMSITEHLTANVELSAFDFKEYTMGELATELKKLN